MSTEIYNTHGQLKAALAAGYAWPFAITAETSGARHEYFYGWAVYHPTLQTDPTHRPIGQRAGRKVFPQNAEEHWELPIGLPRKQAALKAAQAWVAKAYGYTGKWKRNRMHDYIPAEIAQRWPLEDHHRTASGLKVFAWPGFRSGVPNGGQVREICAVKSQAELFRLMGWKPGKRVWNLRVTGNNDEITAATAKPGKVLWRPLDDRSRPWREG